MLNRIMHVKIQKISKGKKKGRGDKLGEWDEQIHIIYVKQISSKDKQ